MTEPSLAHRAPARADATRSLRAMLDTVTLRRATLALYLLTGLAVGFQRWLGYAVHPHWTFPVFRASFWHLVRQQDLYAQWAERDLFKYSPTAALLFAPFAVLPFGPAIVLWDVVNALALWWAIDRLLPGRAGTIALLLAWSEVLVAAQASQSNALVASLIIAAFIALERERQLAGATAIATGAMIKIFPLAALSMALVHRRRLRFALLFTAAFVALLALPLLLTPAHVLVAQYRSWQAIESRDALDRGASMMGLLARTIGLTIPNWPIQVAGTLALLAPLVLRRDRWTDADFRRRYLASLLVYVVLFNHQAERPSFIIAVSGVAIWYAISAKPPWRTALAALALLGLGAPGVLPAWIVMQVELLRSPPPLTPSTLSSPSR